jgi:hypothetical protein
MPDAHGVSTLGWDVLGWASEYLAQPDGVNAGDPWEWTPTQARIVAWWYAVDEAGGWLFRRGQIVLPKGSGKSPVAAALSCCELAGPVVFDGFDASGEAVGRPHPSPHVQLAAVSQDQTDNTMSLVRAMLREGRAAQELDVLDVGVTRILTRNGKLEPVTASASSREGQRLTAAILDEPHLWLNNNGGHRLAATLRRNLGKMNGRSIETTNAWLPGEDSVAELTSMYADKIAEQQADATVKVRVREEGLLRYHPTALVKNLADESELREALTVLYRDAPWINIDRIVSEVFDPGTHPADARRFYLNEVTSADDALVTASEWKDCELDDVLSAGEEITLGLDGSKSDDSTVLVAMRVQDRFATVIAAQEKDPKNPEWQVDREFFDGMVASMFAQYRVVGFYSDVAHFETYVDRWSSEYGADLQVKACPQSAVGWDMRSRLQQLTFATERLVAGIRDGSVRHDGGTLLRRHVLNARRRPNRWGISFGKERRDSPRKVDAFAALQLADMARADFVTAESKTKKRTGNVW